MKSCHISMKKPHVIYFRFRCRFCRADKKTFAHPSTLSVIQCICATSAWAFRGCLLSNEIMPHQPGPFEPIGYPMKSCHISVGLNTPNPIISMCLERILKRRKISGGGCSLLPSFFSFPFLTSIPSFVAIFLLNTQTNQRANPPSVLSSKFGFISG